MWVGIKKGQVAIFAILAIVIVSGVLIYLLWPKIRGGVTEEINPEGYIKNCVKSQIEESINLVGKRGGSINPSNTLLYSGERVEYLCYTNKFYKTCVNQQPLLKQHVEYEIGNYVRPKAEECVNSLINELKSKGYEVNNDRPKIDISVGDNSVDCYINMNLAVSKGTTQSYSSIKVNANSDIYNMLMIAGSIVNYEAVYGDSDIWTFMIYYPELKVEKIWQDDGSKVYVITSRDSEEEFIFATRSLAWPPGYNFS